MGPEAEIERTIRKEAIAFGWTVYKIAFVGTKGGPDRLFGRMGRGIWIEFKAPGETPTSQQAKRHRELREEFGYEVHACDSLYLGRHILGLPDIED